MTKEEIKSKVNDAREFFLLDDDTYGSFTKFEQLGYIIDQLQKEIENQKEALDKFKVGNFDILELLKILDMFKPYIKFETNIKRHPELLSTPTFSILNVHARFSVCGEEEKILKEWLEND